MKQMNLSRGFLDSEYWSRFVAEFTYYMVMGIAGTIHVEDWGAEYTMMMTRVWSLGWTSLTNATYFTFDVR